MASLRRIERLQEHLTAADAVETVCRAGAGAGGAAAAALDGESAGLAADAAAFVTKWVDARPGIDPTHSLRGQTLLVTGGSRGIGLAIALAAAKEGANVAICAKTVEAHPTLPGTIFTAAKAVEDAGGRAIAIQCDIRYEEQVQAAVDKTVAAFGGIDILVNNASAISLTPTEATPMKRYDLMHSINARGTFLCSKLCIPHLKRSKNAHILTLSPPLSMDAKWFAPHVAYTMAKYGMSMCVLGMAKELEADGIAVNALWPRTAVATAAVKNLLGGTDSVALSRTPEIMGDAAHAILKSDSRTCSGNFFIDDEVLVSVGVKDFSKYNVSAGVAQHDLMPDFFID